MNKIYKNAKRNHQRYVQHKNIFQHFQTNDSPIATQAKENLMKIPELQNTLEMREWKLDTKKIIDCHTHNISGWLEEKQIEQSNLFRLIRKFIPEKKKQTNNKQLKKSFPVKKEKQAIVKLKSLYQINTVELYPPNFSPMFRRNSQSQTSVSANYFIKELKDKQRKKFGRYLPTNASVSNQVNNSSKSQRSLNKFSNPQNSSEIKNPEQDHNKFPIRRPKTSDKKKNNPFIQQQFDHRMDNFMKSINKYNKVKTEVKKVNRPATGKQQRNKHIDQKSMIYGIKVNLK